MNPVIWPPDSREICFSVLVVQTACLDSWFAESSVLPSTSHTYIENNKKRRRKQSLFVWVMQHRLSWGHLRPITEKSAAVCCSLRQSFCDQTTVKLPPECTVHDTLLTFRPANSKALKITRRKELCPALWKNSWLGHKFKHNSFVFLSITFLFFVSGHQELWRSTAYKPVDNNSPQVETPSRTRSIIKQPSTFTCREDHTKLNDTFSWVSVGLNTSPKWRWHQPRGNYITSAHF